MASHAVFSPGAIQFVIVVYVKQGGRRLGMEVGLVVRVGNSVGRVVSVLDGQVVTGLHVLLSLLSKILESAEFRGLSSRPGKSRN